MEPAEKRKTVKSKVKPELKYSGDNFSDSKREESYPKNAPKNYNLVIADESAACDVDCTATECLLTCYSKHRIEPAVFEKMRSDFFYPIGSRSPLRLIRSKAFSLSKIEELVQSMKCDSALQLDGDPRDTTKNDDLEISVMPVADVNYLSRYSLPLFKSILISHRGDNITKFEFTKGTSAGPVLSPPIYSITVMFKVWGGPGGTRVLYYGDLSSKWP